VPGSVCKSGPGFFVSAVKITSVMRMYSPKRIAGRCGTHCRLLWLHCWPLRYLIAAATVRHCRPLRYLIAAVAAALLAATVPHCGRCGTSLRPLRYLIAAVVVRHCRPLRYVTASRCGTSLRPLRHNMALTGQSITCQIGQK
jgi:hypothetical protein